jgi:hypothetical protein
MSTKQAMKKAIKIIGIMNMARGLGISHQRIYQIRDSNKMPRTEFSCESKHSLKIQELTKNKVTVKQLLGHVPACIADEVAKLESPE